MTSLMTSADPAWRRSAARRASSSAQPLWGIAGTYLAICAREGHRARAPAGAARRGALVVQELLAQELPGAGTAGPGTAAQELRSRKPGQGTGGPGTAVQEPIARRGRESTAGAAHLHAPSVPLRFAVELAARRRMRCADDCYALTVCGCGREADDPAFDADARVRASRCRACRVGPGARPATARCVAVASRAMFSSPYAGAAITPPGSQVTRARPNFAGRLCGRGRLHAAAAAALRAEPAQLLRRAASVQPRPRRR
jgi:hypothetical protein